MTAELLWTAKANALASFVGGPAIMIDDDTERDRRLVSVLVVIEMEYEAMQADLLHHGALTGIRREHSVTPIRPREAVNLKSETIHASNTRINWGELVEMLRANPGVVKTLLYDDMHTAVVTASRTHRKYPDVDAMTERRTGASGAVILSVR